MFERISRFEVLRKLCRWRTHCNYDGIDDHYLLVSYLTQILAAICSVTLTAQRLRDVEQVQLQ